MGNILLKGILAGTKIKDILIKGNIIEQIKENIILTPEQEKDCRIMDCSGKAAIPGFVNMHTHSAMTLTRGYKEDTALQEWLQHIWAV